MLSTKIWITAYDFFSAHIAEKSGIDTILLGDSLGMSVYGDEDTTKVTREIMARHFEAVKKGAPNTRIVVDFPFGCDRNILVAVETAEYFANIGAKAFKIEGGLEMLEIFIELKNRGYEIIGHLGITPQKLPKEKWKLQGKTKEEAEKIFSTVKKFSAIGIKEIVLECVPEALSKKIQENFSGDIIGIGAGRNLNAQILVFDDVIGKTSTNFSPRFVKRFGNAEENAYNAVKTFIKSVKNKSFPGEENVFL